MNPFRKTLGLAAFVAALGGGGALQAAIVMAVGEPTGTLRNDSYPYAGYGFYVPSGSTVTVNELGYWDQGGDGLSASHTVSLFQYKAGSNQSYTLLATVTVPAGTGATLEGGYRWLPVSDVILTDNGQGGNYYVIMASHDTDAWSDGLGSGGPMLSSFGTISTGALDFGGGPGADEIHSSGATIYGGANFGYSSVPEASSALIAGVGALGLMRRRKR